MVKTGKCLWFDIKKGFGFIHCEGQDVFVHYSKIEAPMGEFRALAQDDIVEFEMFEADRGAGKSKPQAKNVKLIKEGQHENPRKNKTNDIR